jgi:O-antigen/teichoic acid export membrane protein
LPFGLIQGVGRPDITAKFHLLELPAYLLLLWYAVQAWGVVGAAVAWTARVGADLLLLSFYVRATNRIDTRVALEARSYRLLEISLLLMACGWLLDTVVPNPILKVAVWAVLSGTMAWVAWRWLLTGEERCYIGTRGARVARVMVGRPAAGKKTSP